MSLARHAAAIAGKDLRLESRGRVALTAVLPFAATLLISFGLSLGPDRGLLRQTAPALLWLAILFAAILSFRESYRTETEDGALEGLVLAPVDRAAVFLGKAMAVAAHLVAMGAVLAVLVAILFGVTLGSPVPLGAVLILGTVGLCAVGSLFGVLAEQPRAREAVFPLLVLPLVVPVLLAATRASSLVATGQDVGSWLGLLVAFDAVFLGLGSLVFGHLLED